MVVERSFLVIENKENHNISNQLGQDRKIKEKTQRFQRYSTECEFRVEIVLNAGRLKGAVHSRAKVRMP